MTDTLDPFLAAWDAQKAARTTPAPAAVGDPTGDAGPYIAGILRKLAETPEGQRNVELNQAAHKLGRLVAAGYLPAEDARQRVEAVGHAIGLEAGEIVATVNSGLTAGQRNPLYLPARFNPKTGETWAPSGTPGATPLSSSEPPGSHGSSAASQDGSTSDGSTADGEPDLDEQLSRVDWQKLWDEDDDEFEWIVQPIIPARRLIALYSTPKVGKSLLLLELAAAVATGRKALGYDTARRRVLYVDMENDPKADVRRRLRAMGYKADDLDDLVYLSFPNIAALDSWAGGLQLLAAVDAYDVELVVIDTVSRIVAGDENENDTWLAFYRHTGLGLKQRGVALVRLDHAGKDVTKGQRGGSAKGGDVDAVWRMVDSGLDSAGRDRVALRCEMHRFPLAEVDVTLTRHENPLRHEAAGAARSAAFDGDVNAVLETLKHLEAPKDISQAEAERLLRAHGSGVGRKAIREAHGQYVGVGQGTL